MQVDCYLIRRVSNPTQFLSKQEGALLKRKWTDNPKKVEIWPAWKIGPTMTLKWLQRNECTWAKEIDLADCEITKVTLDLLQCTSL